MVGYFSQWFLYFPKYWGEGISNGAKAPKGSAQKVEKKKLTARKSIAANEYTWLEGRVH